jgi:dUTP pyrophosphatase
MSNQVKVVNQSNNELPKYQTDGASGMDLKAYVPKKEDEADPFVVLKKGHRMIVGTGLFLEIPVGFEGQIRPRSGLAISKGITVLNSPGTIDSDYRGEVGVILANYGEADFVINNGERIAQIVFAPVERMELVEDAPILSETKRGKGGFGSTGEK